MTLISLVHHVGDINKCKFPHMLCPNFCFLRCMLHSFQMNTRELKQSLQTHIRHASKVINWPHFTCWSSVTRNQCSDRDET